MTCGLVSIYEAFGLRKVEELEVHSSLNFTGPAIGLP